MPPKRFLKHGIIKRKENESNQSLNIDLCIIVPVISNCDSVNLQNISVTLTFEEGTWFLDTAECCHEIDICAVISKSLNA
jgi:hypothetical protein